MRVAGRELAGVVKELERRAGRSLCAIVLVGSAARRTEGRGSDVDLLVIGGSISLTGWTRPGWLDLHVQTTDHFLAAIEAGEDFQAWAVRYGRPVVERGSCWAETRRRAVQTGAWPDWRRKIAHAGTRLRTGRELLRAGDHRAATEEFRHCAAHLARALLLRAGAFPLSRPELADQVDERGRARLAADMRALESPVLLRKELEGIRARLGASYRALANEVAAEVEPRALAG